MGGGGGGNFQGLRCCTIFEGNLRFIASGVWSNEGGGGLGGGVGGRG